MNIYFKNIYFSIPCKRFIFSVLKYFINPSIKLAGYLKFRGLFTFSLPDGTQVKLYNDNSTLPSLLFWKGIEGYEKCSLEVWRKLSKRSYGIIDAGANIGLFGLIAKVSQPLSNVILFEPLERNVARIRRNFEVNSITADVCTAAIGDIEGQVTFFDMKSDENTIGSISKSFVEKHEHHTEIISIVVPMITIDAFVMNRKMEVVDLIKIDVEGADYLALKGAETTLSNFRPQILIEITNNESWQNIMAFLKSLPFNYYLYHLSDENGLTLFQNCEQEISSGNYLFSTYTEQELKLYGINVAS